MKKKAIIVFLLGLFAVLPTEAKRWNAHDVIGIIKKVNRYWQENNPAEVNAFWDNAAYHTGNIEVYKLLKDEDMLNYSRRWAAFNHWMEIGRAHRLNSSHWS